VKALDFWATDAWTDGELPSFDEWSRSFRMREWVREVTRDEVLLALGSIPTSGGVGGRTNLGRCFSVC